VELNTESTLEKVFKSGQIAVTSECGPPRSSDPAHIIEKADLIKDHVDAINITDNQTSVARICSLAACVHLKNLGLEPVLQMVARDRNRIALQSDILGAASFGINNVLCLSGDHQSFGDHRQAQNVFDLDSMQLLQTVRYMRDQSKFLSGDGLRQQLTRSGQEDIGKEGLVFGKNPIQDR
jgi:methylenetetrahydrofolate reductase (NADPH)